MDTNYYNNYNGSQNQNQNESQETAYGQTQNLAGSQGQNQEQTYSQVQDNGYSQSQNQEQSYSQAQDTSYSQSQGTAYSQAQNQGTSYGQGQDTAYSQAQNQGTSYGQAQDTAYSQAQNQGASYGQAQDTSYGQNQGASYSQNQTQSYGQAQNTAAGQSQDPGASSLYSYSFVKQKAQNSQNASATQSQGYTQSQQFAASGAPASGKKKKARKEKRKGGFGKTLAKCAAIALVFGLVGGTVFYGTGVVFDYATGGQESQQTAGTSVNQDNGGKLTTTSTGTKAVVSDVSEVVENVMPSIVAITNLSVQQVQSWFGQTFQQEIPSAGSGIIVAQTDELLYIATNNHVVSGATTLTVNFVDDTSVAAEIKGTDSTTDLAVITVKISDIPSETMSKIKVATLGSSDNLKVGEPAVAIGNALGYGQSVTTGVISALNREVTVTDQNNNTVTNSLIQTDAAINPGNSGGALLNINGEVVGINSVKYTDTDVEGMGYAIPIDTAEPIINDLISKEKVDDSQAAYLGVTGVDVNDELGDQFNMPNGIYLTQVVEGSAADQAGIRPGDILTAFDGREVNSMDALSERMKYYAAGTTVEVSLKVSENGEWIDKTVTVTLGKRN